MQFSLEKDAEEQPKVVTMSQKLVSGNYFYFDIYYINVIFSTLMWY